MYGTPPGIPGLVQMNITNSAEEKWALLDKDIEIQISTTDARSPICAERSTFLVVVQSRQW